jgi:hypothetical protein
MASTPYKDKKKSFFLLLLLVGVDAFNSYSLGNGRKKRGLMQ